MSKLRLGLISFDYGHQEHYGRLLVAHPGVELVAVSDYSGAGDESLAAGHVWAQRHEVPFYKDYADMLAQHELDAVSIAVPPAVNAEVVQRVARAGVHIMCEKPIAVCLEGMDLIYTVVRQSGIKFTFAFPAATFTKPFMDALEVIDQGAVGEPLIANYTYLQPKGPLYTVSLDEATPEYKESRGGGELANFAGYGVVLLQHVFKRPIESVYAEIDSFFYDSYKKIDMEDMGLITVKYQGGALANLVIGRTTTQSMPHTDLRLEIIGDAGAINVNNGTSNRIIVYEDYTGSDGWDKGGYNWEFYGADPATMYVDDFVKSVLQDRSPRITVDDARVLATFLQAVYRSAKLKQPVALADIGRHVAAGAP